MSQKIKDIFIGCQLTLRFIDQKLLGMFVCITFNTDMFLRAKNLLIDNFFQQMLFVLYSSFRSHLKKRILA